MVNNTTSFTAYGITLHLPDGDVILNAGANITLQPAGDMVIISAQIPANVVFNNTTPYQPPSLSDAKAPKGSVYYSTDAAKLVFKDFSSTVHPLY